MVVGFETEQSKIRLALEVLLDMLANPLFDQHAYEEELGVVQAEIVSNMSDTGRFCRRRLREMLWGGGNHPLSRPPTGEENDMETWSLDQATSLYSQIRDHGSAHVIAVGSFASEEIVGMVNESWRIERIPSLSDGVWKGADVISPAVTVVPRGMDVSHIAIGFALPPVDARSLGLWRLASSALADGMTSTLYEALRFRSSLAYDVFSRFKFHIDGSELILEITAPARKAREALVGALEILYGDEPFGSGYSVICAQKRLATEWCHLIDNPYEYSRLLAQCTACGIEGALASLFKDAADCSPEQLAGLFSVQAKAAPLALAFVGPQDETEVARWLEKAQEQVSFEWSMRA